MFRTLPVCAVLLALSPAVFGQEKPAPKETIIRMTIYPAAAPKPALKYQLLPELHEMNPGNPVHGYLKCFSEQYAFWYNKEVTEQRYKWSEMPLKDLPVKELRHYGGSALRQADDAARLDRPDWQMLIPLKRDGGYTLVPEIQQMRELALALQVRFRGEIADRRFDDAIVTAKTMFALAQHFEEHPTILGLLVGTVIATIATEPVEEMIQQPGCPNLFWALTDLPNSLVDIRKGVQGEQLIWRKDLGILDENKPMTEDELQKAIAKWQQMLEINLGKKIQAKAIKVWLDNQIKDAARVRAARQRLIEAGIPKKTIEKLPPAQVMLLDQKHGFEIALHDAHKALRLPYWQAEKVYADLPKKNDADASPLMNLLDPRARGLKLQTAQVRLEQRLALLRHIEALRMYAAENDSRLPKQLSDIKLPLPVDPVTGQPFTYALKNNTATLRPGLPAGAEGSVAWDRRYVITVGK